MTPDENQRARMSSILAEALELPASDREAYVKNACESEPDLLRNLLSLLRYDRPDAIPALPNTAGLATSAPTQDRRRIEKYTLLKEVGRGGMGNVFLAVRDDDEYRKHVCIKLIRTGVMTRETLHRFRQERQILAALEHDYIARLFDGGTTSVQEPYFVLEYVDGLPIDEYCESNGLPLAARLELFLKVCEAVRFAHQNLVVHRDLKCSNILVTAAETPKLLDFGIAKLINADLFPAAPLVTRPGTAPLTPAYASPEQILDKPLTTSTDVYSLGVILFRLLTGTMPYSVEGLSLREAEMLICEAEPMRPSAAADAAAPSECAKDGGVPKPAESARRRKRELKGDLDNIVLKALQKEPNRRYLSVEQFSEDVRRYLDGRPVLARKDTWGYRASKFVNRHRLGTGFVAALLALVIALAIQSHRIASERDRAESESQKAQAISAFLQDALGAANPADGIGRDVSVLETLDDAATRLADSFASEPEIKTALQMTIGETYRRLARFDEAERLFDAALRTRRELFRGEHSSVAESLSGLARSRMDQGEYQSAKSLYREALTMRRMLLGAEHVDTAQTVNDLAAVLALEGDYDAAESLYREALGLWRALVGDRSEHTAGTVNNLALLLRNRGDYDGAEPLFREALTLHRELLGDDHPDTVAILNNLGLLLRDQREFDAAEPLLREALTQWRRVLGVEHPDVATSMSNLALLLKDQGDYEAAEPLFREAVAMDRKLLGGQHTSLAIHLSNLATLLVEMGRADESEPLHEEACNIFLEALGPESWPLAHARSNYGAGLTQLGRYQQAEQLLVHAHWVLRNQLGEQHVRSQTAARRLVELYQAQGELDKAAEYQLLLE